MSGKAIFNREVGSGISGRFERVDVLRAVAIIAVFLFHYWWNVVFLQTGINPGDPGSVSLDLGPRLLRLIAEHGYLGVRLFFVISGFCIHLSFLKWTQKHPAACFSSFLPHYIWRRFWRIYPPYALVLLPLWAVQYGPELTARAFRHLAVHGLLVHNLSKAFIGNISVPFWSIAVEWQLYLVYPLFLLASRWWGMVPAFGVASLFAILVEFGGPHLTDSYLVLKSPFAYWFEWTLGALIAHHAIWGGRAFPRPGCWAAVLWMLLATALLFKTPWIVRYLLSTLACGALLMTAIDSRRLLGWWERRLVPVGICSYSVYLLHDPLLEVILRLTGPIVRDGSGVFVWVLLLGATFGVVLISGALYHRFVECVSVRTGNLIEPLANSYIHTCKRRLRAGGGTRFS